MSLLSLFLPRGSPFEPEPEFPPIDIVIPVPAEEDMPYYDTLARITVRDGPSEENLVRFEDSRRAYTEQTIKEITIATSATDVLIDFGGVSLPRLIYIESSSTSVPLYYKWDDAGNPVNVINDGFVLVSGNLTTTSLYVTNQSSTDTVTIKLIVLG